MGVQLAGRVGDDARLMRTAHWLAAHVASTTPQGGTA
jgi:aspartyl-tRNA(Asn)/glutamyl-tRNA(Gln) amidotransferase subunit A